MALCSAHDARVCPKAQSDAEGVCWAEAGAREAECSSGEGRRAEVSNVGLALNALKTAVPQGPKEDVGPRGGDLNHPNGKREYRIQGLNVAGGEAGMQLHRFERPETTVVGRRDEQPWHRMAAFMLLAGRTNSEIALAANVTPIAVAHIRAQRWFQELLAVLANEAGQDIMGLLQSEAQASLNKMIEIRDAVPTTPSIASDRLSYQAAKDLLELAHGKATQTVISSISHTTHVDPSEEMADIQQQLAALRASPAQKRAEVLTLPAT